MGLVVQKYGGTSVAGVDRIRHVAGNIRATVAKGDRCLVVVSAMGDQTDDLLKLAYEISPTPPRRELDMLLTSGERIAMALLSIALNDCGVKAVSLTGSQSGVITDTVHGNARVSQINGYRITEQLERETVVIVAGFQGVTRETREITTLGRGGSDLSAVALAAHFKADRCQLYKDVEGIFSADPRLVPGARKLDLISWERMAVLAWSGASVVQPRSCHLAMKYRIPIEVRSTFDLQKQGTLIATDSRGGDEMESFFVQAVTQKRNMSIVRAKVTRDQSTAIDQLRLWLWEAGETPQIQFETLRAGIVEVCWSVPRGLLSGFIERARDLGASEIQNDDCSLVTIVGGGFFQSPELFPEIRLLVPSVFFHVTSNQTLTLALPEKDVDEAIRKLHVRYIESLQ